MNMNKLCQYQFAAAFSLWEALIVMALLAMISTWAIPGFSRWQANHELANAASQMRQALQFARLQALLQQRKIIVCGAASAVACAQHLGQQLLIFRDDYADERLHQATQILRFIHLPIRLMLQYRGFRQDQHIVFWPSGMTFDNGTITVAATNNTLKRYVIVSTGGRVRVQLAN